MSQLGWTVVWDDSSEPVPYTFASLIEWSKTYPEGFDYTPGILEGIRAGVEVLRDYFSPSMLGSCPRQQALMRLTDYFVPLSNQWSLYRGTLAHLLMEKGWNEDDSILETEVWARLNLGDTVVTFTGHPDKIVPLEGGSWLLIDFKTTDELARQPKHYWIAQLNCYAWLLEQNGKHVSRAFIQQISMKAPRRTEVPLWPLEETEKYIIGRAQLHALTFTGKVSLDNLPPMLDPVLDSDNYWMCLHKGNWCPVRDACLKFAAEGH